MAKRLCGEMFARSIVVDVAGSVFCLRLLGFNDNDRLTSPTNADQTVNCNLCGSLNFHLTPGVVPDLSHIYLRSKRECFNTYNTFTLRNLYIVGKLIYIIADPCAW